MNVVKIKITPDDLNAALATDYSGCNCPAARAMEREGYRRIQVLPQYLVIYTEGPAFEVPRDLAHIITRFDWDATLLGKTLPTQDHPLVGEWELEQIDPAKEVRL